MRALAQVVPHTRPHPPVTGVHDSTQGGEEVGEGAGGGGGEGGGGGGGGGGGRRVGQRNSAADFFDGLGDMVVEALDSRLP